MKLNPLTRYRLAFEREALISAHPSLVGCTASLKGIKGTPDEQTKDRIEYLREQLEDDSD